MHQDPSSQEYADEVARLRASESDSDAELLVCLDIFIILHTSTKELGHGRHGLGLRFIHSFVDDLYRSSKVELRC